MTLDEKMERQDASIKKMAKALREGARMLDLACPVCNNPIFQTKSGTRICVSCERMVMFENEMHEQRLGNAVASKNEVPPVQLPANKNAASRTELAHQPISIVLGALKERCVEKLAMLVTKMDQLSDEKELSVVYDNLLKILKVMKQIGFPWLDSR